MWEILNNSMNRWVELAIAIAATITLLCVVGSFYKSHSVEQPQYVVIYEVTDHVTVRQYGNEFYAKAEGENLLEALNKIKAYQKGENSEGVRIQKSYPYEIQYHAPIPTVRWQLPNNLNLGNAPRPTNDVKLEMDTPKNVGVIRFQGPATQESVEAKEVELYDTLRKFGIIRAGDAVLFEFYNENRPTIVRRNELAIEVLLKEK
jgi:hypothetical protein